MNDQEITQLVARWAAMSGLISSLVTIFFVKGIPAFATAFSQRARSRRKDWLTKYNATQAAAQVEETRVERAYKDAYKDILRALNKRLTDLEDDNKRLHDENRNLAIELAAVRAEVRMLRDDEENEAEECDE